MMLSDLNAWCSRSALHWCIVGKVSRTAEVRRQIEFVLVIFFFLLWLYPKIYHCSPWEKNRYHHRTSHLFSNAALRGNLQKLCNLHARLFYRYALMISYSSWWREKKKIWDEETEVVTVVSDRLYFWLSVSGLCSQALMMFNWTHFYW